MLKRRWRVFSAFLVVVVLSLALPVPSRAIEEADRLWLVGEQAFVDKAYVVARRALERFVAQFPRDARRGDALLLLGKAQLALDDAQAAAATLAQASALPTPPGQSMEARFWEAEALFRLRRWREARVAYDDVVRTNAASSLAPDAMYGRGWSDFETGQHEAAAASFRDFLSAWPDHALAPSATMALARSLVELKRYAEALPLLADFRRKYPTARQLADAQYLLGWVKVTNGDPRGGLADLRAFVAAHPNHEQAATARQLITQTVSKYGEREELADSYKALMDQQPATAEALFEAASIAARLGRPKDQGAAWKRLRDDFPDHVLTQRLALDLANDAFKKNQWPDVVSYGQAAGASHDAAVKSEGWLLVGEAELKRKRFPAAAKAFENVGSVDGAETSIRFRALAGLGLAREEQKEWKAALAAYETVVNRSPDATLRDWARKRVAEVKTRMSATPAPKPAPKPDAKPAPQKAPQKKS